MSRHDKSGREFSLRVARGVIQTLSAGQARYSALAVTGRAWGRQVCKVKPQLDHVMSDVYVYGVPDGCWRRRPKAHRQAVVLDQDYRFLAS